MADLTPPPVAPFTPPAQLKEATSKTGKTCSIACNLPHGLQIIHRDRTLRVHGANHPRAIQTGVAMSSKWGITHDVDEEWFDDWVKAHNHPAVANGHVMKNTRAKIEAQVDATGDAIQTGTDQLDPFAKGFKEAEGVEKREDDEE